MLYRIDNDPDREYNGEFVLAVDQAILYGMLVPVEPDYEAALYAAAAYGYGLRNGEPYDQDEAVKRIVDAALKEGA